MRDLKVRVRGNDIIIPVNLQADNRFRSTSSNFLLQQVSYAPNDCFAVIGTCRYEVMARGQRARLISETTEENGIWRTRTRLDPRDRRGQPARSESSIYSIDKNGVPIDIAVIGQADGQKSVVTIRRR